MKPAPNSLLAAALVAGFFVLPGGLGGCDGGTSSETVGMVEAAAGRTGITGKTDPGNEVALYAADFLPHLERGFAQTGKADSNGRFAFANLEAGRYRLLARRPSDGWASLLAELDVPAGSDSIRRGALEPTGSLSGTITDSLPALSGVAYAPGTPFFALGDSLMRYEMTGLPAGEYRIVKAWKREIHCMPGAACGGIDSLSDSAEVRILPGESVIR